jgi:hypothetical protein
MLICCYDFALFILYIIEQLDQNKHPGNIDFFLEIFP